MEGARCLNILTVGDAAVGKSSLIKRFTKNTFSLTPQATIGVDFEQFKYRTEDNMISKFKFWNLGGFDRFHSTTYSFYKKSQGIIVVFDLTN